MKVGIIQITSSLDPKDNLNKIRTFLDEAKKEAVDAVFLPEVFFSMSDATTPTPHLVDPEGGEHFESIASLAKDYGVYLLGGTAATKPYEGEKVLNRCYNFSPDGKLIDFYDKMNLFSCDLSKHSSKTSIDEADVYQAGNTPKMIDVKNWKLGISVCFDLRFPEIFRRYSAQGAQILTCSAAFTKTTGKAHWETLLRARAIENQCYVIAPAQWGDHNPVIKTWGHSLIIDPWGEILADAKEGEKLITAELSLDRLNDIRSRLDVIREI